MVNGFPDGFYVKSIRSGEADVLAFGLDMTKGTPQALEVIVSPDAASAKGRVQDQRTGQSAPGATVVLAPQEKERRDQAAYYRVTWADQDGNYDINNVVPGEYKAFAWEDIENGAYMDPDFMKLIESKGEAVTFGESDRKTVALILIPAQ